jgi:hypothetical protein
MERDAKAPPTLSEGQVEPRVEQEPPTSMSAQDRDAVARRAFSTTIERLEAAIHVVRIVQTCSLIGVSPQVEEALATAVIGFLSATEKLPQDTEEILAVCQHLPKWYLGAPQQVLTTDQQPMLAQQEPPVKPSSAATKKNSSPTGPVLPSGSSNRPEAESLDQLKQQIEREALTAAEGRQHYARELERYHKQRLALPQ